MRVPSGAPLRAFAFAFLFLMMLLPGAAAAFSPTGAPRIGVLVMRPGTVFWERFGHDAILVRENGSDISYNFGFFDPEEADFVGNFVHGRMQYYLVSLPLDVDLAQYREERRGVSVLWLDLDPEQARAMSQELAAMARPWDGASPQQIARARYRYDYYLDNCSTRVRDAIDRALGGALRKQFAGRSRGNTWRSESVRLAWPAKWMAFGFHLGLGGAADRPLSRWDEAFIPMRLRELLLEARRPDGRPLVIGETPLSQHLLPPPPEEAPRWRVPALLIGLALAIAVTWLGSRKPRLLAGLAMPFWLFAGLAGALMAFLWFGTEHYAAHGNENLLLLSPLALGLLPGAWRVMRGREGGRVFRILLWTLAGLAAVAAFLKFLPFRPQQNVEWVLLLLPVHLALARRLDPRRA